MPSRSKLRACAGRSLRWVGPLTVLGIIVASCSSNGSTVTLETAEPSSSSVASPTSSSTSRVGFVPAVVNPTVGLRHGQAIEVEVVKGLGGFVADICIPDGRCAFFSDKAVQTNARFTLEVTRFVPNGSSSVDCAERPGRCVLRISGSSQSDGDTPLTFDDTKSALPVGVHVFPETPLRAGQLVKVFGTLPGPPIAIAQCPPTVESSPYESCPELGRVTPDDEGNFSIDVRVVRSLAGRTRDFDCAVDACSLRLYPNTVKYARDPARASFPLTFDASQPASPPAVRIDTTVVRDGTRVTITGEHLASGNLWVKTCEKDVDIKDSPCGGTTGGGKVGNDGTFSIVFRIEQTISRRLPGSMEFRHTDCAVVPCELRITGEGTGRPFIVGPLVFATD